MKKIITILVFMLSCFAFGQPQITNASVGNLKSTIDHSATDTITNAVTKYQYGIIKGYYDVVVIQPTFTKISGTASATVKAQGSVDGVSYSDIGSAYTVTDVATQTTTFTISPSSYQYYRLSIVPTGTQSVKVVTPVLVRKK